jgi:hypothetical protein
MGEDGSIRSGGKKGCEIAETLQHKTKRRRQASESRTARAAERGAAVQGGLRPQMSKLQDGAEAPPLRGAPQHSFISPLRNLSPFSDFHSLSQIGELSADGEFGPIKETSNDDKSFGS